MIILRGFPNSALNPKPNSVGIVRRVLNTTGKGLSGVELIRLEPQVCPEGTKGAQPIPPMGLDSWQVD